MRPRTFGIVLGSVVFAIHASDVAASPSPSTPEAPWAWVSATRSPSPMDAGSLTDREAELQSSCGVPEAGLREVAKRLVARRLQGKAPLDLDALSLAERVAGEPHVWPRAWVISGRALDHATTLTRLAAWGRTFQDAGERRCGVATGYATDGAEVVAAVALDAAGDLSPLPIRARTGAWLSVDAHLLVAASEARVIVLGPSGEPHSVPTSFEHGHVRARFAPDRPGQFTVQVIAETDKGPRPVLEAQLFADVDPPTATPNLAAPGEEAGGLGDETVDKRQALTNMLRAMRASEGLPELARDARLDALALAHARRMMEAGAVAHDLGDGSPAERLVRAGIDVRESGENVAHAESVALAHRALYASPSHRANLVRAQFDRVGIAVLDGPDGTAWVEELFAAAR